MVGGQLGEKLVVRNAGRRGQAGLVEDAGADFRRRRGRRGNASEIFGNVEIGFVERERLDERRVVREDRTDLLRNGSIDIEPWRHEQKVRAFAQRRARRHRRAHAEGARLVARRGDNPALCRIADRDRAAPRGRIIALLDRRVEGVHIDVDDLACARFAHGKTTLPGRNERRRAPQFNPVGNYVGSHQKRK